MRAASIRLAWGCNKRASVLEDKDALQRRIDPAARYALLDQLAWSPQCRFDSTEEGNVLAIERQTLVPSLSTRAREGSHRSLKIVTERIIATPTEELLNLVNTGVSIHIGLWTLSLVIDLFEASDIVRELWAGVDLFVQCCLQLDGLFLNLFKIEG